MTNCRANPDKIRFKQRLRYYQLIMNCIAGVLLALCIASFFWFKLITDALTDQDIPIAAALNKIAYGAELSLNATEAAIKQPSKKHFNQFNNSWDNTIIPALQRLERALTDSHKQAYTTLINQLKLNLSKLHRWEWRTIDTSTHQSNHPSLYNYNQAFADKARQALQLSNALIKQSNKHPNKLVQIQLLHTHNDILKATYQQHLQAHHLLKSTAYSANDYLQRALKQTSQLKQHTKEYGHLWHDLVTDLQNNLKTMQATATELNTRQQSHANNTAELWLAKHILPSLSSITTTTAKLQKQHNLLLHSQLNSINTMTDLIPLAALLIILGVIALNAITTSKLSKKVMTPLNQITQVISQAKDGELPKQLPQSTEFEIDLLAQALNNQSSTIKKVRATNKGIIDTAVDPIITIDEHGITQLVNAALYNLLGYSEDEILGKNINVLMPPNHSSKHDSYIQHYIKTGNNRIIGKPRTVNALSKSGELIPIRLTVSEFFVEEKRFFSGILYDMRELLSQQHQINQLNRLAKVDPLTQIGNRLLFDEFSNRIFQENLQSQTCWGMMIIDIDDFKSVNDNLGHEAGDDLLKIIASRLAHSIRDSDEAFRIGGDEFIVVLSQLSSANAAQDVAQTLIDNIHKPINIGTLNIVASVSIGIATYPEVKQSLTALFKAADDALYRSKANGKNQFTYYTPPSHKS